MEPTRTTEDVVQALAPVVGPVASAVHLPAGYGNENWRVTTVAGHDSVVKFGPRQLEGKWRASQQAHALAAAAGVPVAPLLHFGYHDDELMRVFGWIDGVPPGALGPEALERLVEELGQAVALLHGVEVTGFSSRIDGSAPQFEHWDDYLLYRFEQVRQRCRLSNAVDEVSLERISWATRRLAQAVAGAARPALCHRDLHGGNILASPDGRLLALLDFDMAEAWDAAGEWFKLNRMVFYELAAEVPRRFLAAYRTGGPAEEFWDERVLVVDLIESLNVVANAVIMGWSASFEATARSWLAESLERAAASPFRP